MLRCWSDIGNSMKIFSPLSFVDPFCTFEGSGKRKAPVGLSLASVILQVLRKWRREGSQQPFLTLLELCKDYKLLFCLGKSSRAQTAEVSLGELQLHGSKRVTAARTRPRGGLLQRTTHTLLYLSHLCSELAPFDQGRNSRGGISYRHNCPLTLLKCP